MQKKEGSILGGILLIAGSCIGAGMLALPIITGVAGFLPSFVMLFAAWLFMTATSILLLEANLALGHDLSLISMAEKTLGKWGKLLCWILFVFLFYSLGIAYISASGSIFQTIIVDVFSKKIAGWVGSTLFTLIFGIFIFFGTRPVDYLNRLLMIGLIIAYFVLIFLGSQHVNLSYLAEKHWKYSLAALPVLIISFGFHNMIPSLTMYFKGDAKRLRLTVWIGSFVPLIIYIIWEAIMLGIIPLEGREGLSQALDQGEIATNALRRVIGSSWINTVAQAFALFAIITSFLAQSLSLVDFLADGLKIPKIRWGRVALILMTLIPPFIFAFAYPGIFINALNLAGGFSAVILFGIIPVLMVWILRYRRGIRTVKMLPLGRTLLSIVILFAVGIFALETAQEMGYSLLPKEGSTLDVK